MMGKREKSRAKMAKIGETKEKLGITNGGDQQRKMKNSVENESQQVSENNGENGKI